MTTNKTTHHHRKRRVHRRSTCSAAQNHDPAAPSERPAIHFTQTELAARWKISPRTLERWRWAGKGPCFIKIGERVVYRLKDIEAFETAQLHTRTDVPAATSFAEANTSQRK